MSGSSKPPLIWLNVFIFLSSFIVAVAVVPWYGMTSGYSVEHLIWFLVAFSFCNLSITAGYHRLWSHKTYEAHWSLRFLFALGGAFALQNSALHWSSDHRIHHKHVDNNDKDPYSAKRGFWFSHIGWMLREYNANTFENYSNCRDLQKDKIVMWQHKYYVPLAIATNFGIPIALGLLHGDILGMLLTVGVLRLVLSHHSTFFINSLAHIWGSQPYTDKNTARDNAVLAVFTFGEGYHNYHHIFENDYRNGIYWWQYDPTKWLIKSCSWLGLTKKLRVTPKLIIEKAKAKQSLNTASRNISKLPNAALLNEALNKEFEALMGKMSDYYDVKKQVLEAKKNDLAKKYEESLLKLRYQQMKQELATQRKSWESMVAQYA
ncbi:fatty acid desaturase [Vibrio europaeus]|uniref:Acyl-CoA desaturase n=1 Tax=Vibrio europaeus TaxID=300876 RepID=A0AAE7DZM9_9VIBR|nr:fatty acid desaturase [Vibrio europaeus]MDC5804816.1 fatty acid desaturase [Vibrio europaeus]MDC5811878.1 fatty acid desaturase [Vibrio europaeus]MDC5827109.1 fatty acid desaturase [Vibrio europaeus]MDC5832475.1 fatty acid desaturase [Vibrio europaeus]MDC5835430.1 fatty acid desaturase [Vibrio europaeus]